MFAIILAGSLAIVGVSLWHANRERQALLELSPEVRARVYQGALATLTEMCPAVKSTPELAERCRHEAEFLSRFPECDEACMRLVRQNYAQPTR
jgi:cytochrome b pre-mRNA-processing protein 3